MKKFSKKLIFYLLIVSLIILFSIDIFSTLSGNIQLDSLPYVIWIVCVGGILFKFKEKISILMKKNSYFPILFSIILIVAQSLLAAYLNKQPIFSFLIPDVFTLIPWIISWNFLLNWKWMNQNNILLLAGIQAIIFEGVFMIWYSPLLLLYWIPNAFFYAVIIFPLTLQNRLPEVKKRHYFWFFLIPILNAILGVIIRELLGLPDYPQKVLWA